MLFVMNNDAFLLNFFVSIWLNAAGLHENHKLMSSKYAARIRVLFTEMFGWDTAQWDQFVAQLDYDDILEVSGKPSFIRIAR